MKSDLTSAMRELASTQRNEQIKSPKARFQGPGARGAANCFLGMLSDLLYIDGLLVQVQKDFYFARPGTD